MTSSSSSTTILDVTIDPITQEWRARISSLDPLHRVRVEKAKTGRATCKYCGDVIRAGEYRVGFPVKWRTLITGWNHPKCWYSSVQVNVEAGEVFGLDQIEDVDELVSLSQELAKTSPPKTGDGNDDIDVESEEFQNVKPKAPPVRLGAPDTMTLALLPFQEEGHAWMLAQERSEYRGGILADEMGLGKTIQTLAMILSDIKENGHRGPTLIVAPSSAMMQWSDEILRVTEEGTLSVLVYQNTARKILTPADILKADVVLTSYPILESDYRQAMNAQKVKCQYCFRMFLPRKLAPHHKYFCGPEAVRTERLQRTERSREQATRRGMQTLGITKSTAITPVAMYNELMEKAGRVPAPMGVSAARARTWGGDATTTTTTTTSPTTTSSTTSSSPVPPTDIPTLIPQGEIDTNVWFGEHAGLFWRSVSSSGGEVIWRTSHGNDSDRLKVVRKEDAALVLRSDKYGVLIRLRFPGRHRCEVSSDNGRVWNEINSEGEFLCPSSLTTHDKCQDTVEFDDPYAGLPVVRTFNGIDVLGVVVGRRRQRQGANPLWRVVHVDGDLEDLDQDELRVATLRSTDLSTNKPLKLGGGNVLNGMMTDALRLTKNEVIDLSQSGEEEESDVRSCPSPSAPSSSKRSNNNAAADDDVVTTDTVAPCFKPQTWGRDNPPAVAKARFAPKPPRKKRAPAKPKPSKKKKAAADESSSSSEDESTSSDNDDDKSSSHATKKEWLYAPFGDVVDEDGVDLNGSLLHCVAYYRIILDEAHKIKERTNSTAKSVFALRGKPCAVPADVLTFEPPAVASGNRSLTPTKTPPKKKVKVNVMDKATPKPKKDPNAPKPAKSAWWFFCEETRVSLGEGLTVGEQQKQLSAAWKQIAKDAKKPYEEKAAIDKLRHTEEMSKYVPPTLVDGKNSEKDVKSKVVTKQAVPNDKVKSKSKTKEAVKSSNHRPVRTVTAPKRARMVVVSSSSSSQEEESGGDDDDASCSSSTSESSSSSSDEETMEEEEMPAPRSAQPTTTPKVPSSSMILHDECRRWALSGTPLMNRFGDVQSLVRFLRVFPFSYYFCKRDCACRLLQWSSANYCACCGHTPMTHYSYFNKHVANPVSRSGYVGQGRRAMFILKEQLMEKIMLRRTKQERKDDLNLPPLDIVVRKVQLKTEERDFYDSVYMLSQAKFDTFVGKGTIMNNYAHVFQLLSRLRQASDHPYLVAHADTTDKDERKTLNAKATQYGEGEADLCGICHLDIDDVSNLAVAACKHTFHRDCVDAHISLHEEQTRVNGGGKSKGKGGKKKGNKPKTLSSSAKKNHKKRTRRDSDEEDEEVVEEQDPTADDDTSDDDEDPCKCPVCFVRLTVTLKLPGIEDAGGGGEVCVVCMDKPRSVLLMPCGHTALCWECARGLENKACPICREKIDKIVKSGGGGSATSSSSHVKPVFGRRSIMQRIDLGKFSSSSKLDAILDEIHTALTHDPTNKVIVFSQFTNFLDIVQWRLETAENMGGEIKVVKLVGALNMEERRSVLKAFKTNPTVRVILMSLKAGGEGLNLQEASHVLSCDVWWNYAVEAQAFHRAHRIGQKRRVTAIRFSTVGTIEERMLELQDKKQLIIDGVVENNAASLARLTEADLKFLFGR